MGNNYYDKRYLYSDEELVKAYLEYGSASRAAEHVDVCAQTILRACKRAEVKLDGRKTCHNGGGSPIKITDEQLIEACKTMTRFEIAEKYGLHPASLPRRYKRLGVEPIREKHPGNANLPSSRIIFGDCWHYVESHDKRCAERHPGFEYLETRKGRIRLRCRQCGTVAERALSTFRQKRICCDACEEREKEEEELMKSRIELMRVFCAIKEKSIPKRCRSCGKEFFSEWQDKLYCSECKRDKSGKNIRKRCRKYGVFYDSSVMRHLVIERDNCVCQICGERCDPNDKAWGSFGPLFPTVDHIIPLAKGGHHVWNNVQCAHAICNSEKRDIIADREGGALWQI